MSFGVIQKLLIQSLRKVRKSICYYMGDTCDCKYLGEDSEIGKGECSGCPELYQAIAIIEAMTPEEFDAIRKRAKVTISEVDFYGPVIQKELKLDQSEITELKNLVAKIKRDKAANRKSAYKPSKLPKGIL